MPATLIQNIKTLYQTTHKKLVRGKEMSNLPHISNAFLLIENKKIKSYGTMETCPEGADEIIDATGKFVLPAFCDSHTHLVFAASRAEEFVMRIQGKTYEEIAAAGGGILNSAKKLQAMSEEELFDKAEERIETIKKTGTGAVEIKSGYGLSVDAELKMLRVISKLKETSGLKIKATFLGAHTIPVEYKTNRQAYIALIINEMLPKIYAEGLADYCDVFCEKNYFTNDETDQILQAAAKYNLRPKIHVNQFTNSGGVQTGVRNHALTVDHLEHFDDAEIECLLNSKTLPVALPSCSFFINIPYAPGRKMIDAGLPLVLASDYNPGSSPSGNIPFVLSLACIKMRLTPEEAINAVTINGAAAMEMEDEVGSIAVGKSANIILTKKMNTLAEIPYSFGQNLFERVFI
ncbi:MAG: imidazolonepropionase [Chitinophagales bacterium]